MTPKQQQFCREYLIDLNATQAAIRAGYSVRTAEVTGSKLLRNAKVAAEVQRLTQERSESTQINAEWVLKRLAKIADFDVRNLFNEDGSLKRITELDDDTAFAIGGIDVTELAGSDEIPPAVLKKFKAIDKRGALELIGRHLKLFTDRVESEAKVSGGVVVYLPDNGRDGGNPQSR